MPWTLQEKSTFTLVYEDYWADYNQSDDRSPWGKPEQAARC